MTEEETLKILAVLRGAYPQFYRSMDKKEAVSIVSLWHEMFSDDDYPVVGAAVKTLIASDDKGFPPTIGQVKSKMRLLMEPNEMTEMEAWSLVMKAIRNSGYNSVEEFQKLPPVLQRVVGKPAQLKEWSNTDSESIQSVVASNFQRSYRARTKQDSELRAIPQDVRALISGLSDRLALNVGGTEE